MDNTGVLSFNREGEQKDRSRSDSSCSASDTPPRRRLGRFIDVYSPEHLNLTPKPRTKLLFTQIKNEGPITLTPEKCYNSDNEYKCWTVKGEGRFRRLYEECSFEGNQSFPRVRRRAADMDLESLRGAVDHIRVDGPNGLRFNSVWCGGGSPSLQPPCNNAGKAVFTIEPHSSKILIVNSAACSLLGYSAGELGGVRFAELVRGGSGFVERGGGGARGPVLLAGKVVELVRKGGGAVPVSLWVRQLESEGPRLVVAEPVAARSLVLTVDGESGAVRAVSGEDAPAVFGADCADRLLGLPVAHLVPAIRLPPAAAGDTTDTICKQRVTGRTLDGGCFPLCLWITKSAAPAPAPAHGGVPSHGTWHAKGKDNVKEKRLLDVNIRVTYNVSGLLVVEEGGTVAACNPHFARLTFGKHLHEVVGRRIDTIIREYCRDADALRLDLDLDPELDLDLDHLTTRDNTDMTLSPLENHTRDKESASESESERQSGRGVEETRSLRVQPSTPTQDMVSSLSTSQRLPDLVSGLSVSEPRAPAPALDLDPPGSDETSADFLTPINEMPPAGDLDLDPPDLDSLDADLEPAAAAVGRRAHEAGGATSTPARGGGGAAAGTYRGTVVHKDGTELPVVYSVCGGRAAGAGGARLTCVWLAVAVEGAPSPPLASASTPDSSLLLGGNKSATTSSRPPSASVASLAADDQLAGDYSTHYVTLKQIGKGAFGCVKMAYRRSDRLLVVTKFILKEKVGAQFWVDGPPPDHRRLPLELSLLLTLKHPNIVSVIDWYENEKYFQMVMEKHGAGMDLFEFIERRPRLDEPLLSYIFRQICEAVHYLHSLNILHRDIKDENVIIDHTFHVKLIDFGSAAFRAPDGGTFSTFYGTTEYCSPEVLAGNPYAGPELEVWAMGVTLYVLAFGAAPFADAEDALRGELALPPSLAGAPARRASPALEAVLRAALARDPARRAALTALRAHPWLTQPVALDRYVFAEVVDCSPSEAAPDTHLPPTRTPGHTLDLSSRSRRGGGGGGDPASLSEDATGHAAADIDIDLDSWDECDQEDSLS